MPNRCEEVEGRSIPRRQALDMSFKQLNKIPYRLLRGPILRPLARKSDELSSPDDPKFIVSYTSFLSHQFTFAKDHGKPSKSLKLVGNVDIQVLARSGKSQYEYITTIH